MIPFLNEFLLFLPSRVCMMIQTVTAQNWTIQAAQNPASLQATGENWTLGTGLFSSKGTMITCRQVAEARGRNWLSVFFGSMESSSSLLTGGHHSDGTRGSRSPQSSLQEPFRRVNNRPSAQTPSYLPGTF